MTESEDEEKKHTDPVKPPASQEVKGGKNAPWRGHAHPEGEPIWNFSGVSLAAKNNYRVIEYLKPKRAAGVLTDDEAMAIISEADKGEAGQAPEPTSTNYAMLTARMIRLIAERHPELASETRSLPSSGDQSR